MSATERPSMRSRMCMSPNPSPSPTPSIATSKVFLMKRLFFLGLLVVAGSLAGAQQQVGQRITPNFKDSDITSIAEAVSNVTGKNFIIDPRVRAQVTMLSSTAMSPDAFYQAFLSILQVHGFVAAPSGN